MAQPRNHYLLILFIFERFGLTHFFAEMLTGASIEFHYLKSTRGSKTPDFLVRDDRGKIVLEVGGRGKGRSQFKGIKVDRKIVLSHGGETDGIRRPLFL